MPEAPIKDLLGLPRKDILPGFTLSMFGIEMYELAESEFARKHLAVTAAAAENVTDRIAEMMLRIANNDVANRRFAFDTPGYRVCAFTLSNLPYLLWLSLTPKHPEITLGEAAKLITKENEATIRRGLFDLQGYTVPKEAEVDPKKPQPAQTATELSSNETLSPTSENNAA